MATNNAINGELKTTIYTASDTWTKDPRSTWITAICVNGGGGGASGRKGDPAGAAATGGGGGCANSAFDSGAGGVGARGQIIVIEYFS